MFLRATDRPRGTRLSLRIAVLGGIAVALFAVLFFRLWSLQILDGKKYLAEAQNNRTREYKVIAPRGNILARNGKVIVDNRTSLALVVTMDKLPADEAKAEAELKRLGDLVHMPPKRVRKVIEESEERAAGAPVTLRQDIGYDVVYYLKENQQRFPGVTVQRVFVRDYPNGDLAAHLLGTVGEIEEEELKEPQYKGLEPGDEVGKSGLERAYDSKLRGTPGVTRVQVNAAGQPTPGGRLVSTSPEPGESLVTTINPAVQEAGEYALSSRGLPGAFVSMNIHTGEILGMGSYPTYDPTFFTEPFTQKEYEEKFGDPLLAPQLNRAIASQYPTGSTYKVITALAALENGVITPSTVVEDPGYIELAGQKFENDEGAVNGSISLVHALQVSSDVFFYKLGLQMWNKNWLQNWSHKLGIGDTAGLDIGGEGETLVPSKAWRDKLAAEGLAEERPWSAGDNIQLATGQGDLQTNPLQMAIAYATLGTGGKVPTPHVGLSTEDAAGRPGEEFEFAEPRRKVKIDAAYQRDILEGLHEAAQVTGGTAVDTFGEFPIPIAGKTGTAERPPNGTQSWFIALSPYPSPDIVTVATIEHGGYGAESAAPAVKEILEAVYSKQIEKAAETETGGEEEIVEETATTEGIG